MEINVLGPLEALEGTCSFAPSAHKPRQVLALLALNAGRVVTTASLMEELWGAEPPRSAATTLQTYIMQLRRGLTAALASGGAPGHRAGPSAKDILATRTCGYVLDLPSDRIDVAAYERLLAAGRSAAERGDDRAASRHLAAALAIWRGPALVDVQKGLLLDIETVRLQESRMTALEARIEADLRLGRHQGLVSELAVLSAQYPMHENIAAAHMTALYRSGRQSSALEVFGRLRRTLVDELGVEPSQRLRRLHAGILGADAALEAPTAQIVA